MLKNRKTYGLCSNCGYAVPTKSMFVKTYHNGGICLCKKCTLKLCTEMADYIIAKGLDKTNRSEITDNLL